MMAKERISVKKLKQMEEEEHREYHRRMFHVLLVIVLMLVIGATFYSIIENWRFLDALYFSAYTMTTVGYGDFVPKTDLGKIFTILYVFAGVGIALYGLSLMASHFVEVREEFWLERLGNMRIKHHTKNIWDKLKEFFGFDSKELVDENNSSYKK